MVVQVIKTFFVQFFCVFLSGSDSKNMPAMWETWVWSLGQEDPLEKEMATHSSILAGKSQGQRSLAVYSSWGGRVRHDWATSSLIFCVFFSPSLITSASVRSLMFLSFLSPSLYEMFPWYLSFLEEISSLSPSIVFLYFFALFTEEGLLISPCCSLELCIQLGVSSPFSIAFCFSSFLSSW